MKAALYVNAFYIEDKLYYTFDRLTYTSFFNLLKKRKIPDLRFSLSYVFETRAFQYLNPVAKYDDFYQMFKDMSNQMKTAIRKEKLMKIKVFIKRQTNGTFNNYIKYYVNFLYILSFRSLTFYDVANNCE